MSRHIPRKRFGQHFLHAPTVIERIVNSIDPRPGEALVEIGPGFGAITLPLLARVREMHAVEIDRDAIRELTAKTQGLGTLHIHEADVLDFHFAQLRTTPQQLRLVGNLPYNISTPLLFRLMEQREHFLDMHFMLQKEVVERMAAQANDDAYGRLSVMLAPWLEVKPLFDIGPGAFRPPPQVTSSFVRLRPYASAPFTIENHGAYRQVVAAAFSQRRKTLRNALKAVLGEELIRAAGIDPGARAETVSPARFAALANLWQREKKPVI
ncbi:MAG: 16S rRNA (adenine(1518)-N(6)/adenine(1519)-N(6))-dimethyltransferase RsmA [Steroidobacteraceae bacterium]